MEDNIYENNGTPEVESPQQPAENPQPAESQQPAEKQLDLSAIASSSMEKAKDIIAKRGDLWEKIKAVPRKIWIMAGAGIVAIIALIVVLSILGNTY